MEKESLFSKINIKDYNNELEKVLDRKVYSVNAKNLLLSMLYKIETAYQDYEEVKREVSLKKDFIEHIIETIDNYCVDIEVVKNNSRDGEELKNNGKGYIIESEKGKIISLDSEKILLEAILLMPKNTIKIPFGYKHLDDAYRKFLNVGYILNKIEMIKDFNGWSWDIVKNNKEDEKYNIVYQTLLYMVGHEVIDEFTDNNNITLDYIKMIEDELNLKYGKEMAIEFRKQLYKILIYLYVYNNKENKTEISKTRKEYEKLYEKMINKEAYLSELTIKKIKCAKRVEKIDKIVNDFETLSREYDKASEEIKQKYLSVSMYANLLEEEREQILQEIKDINNMLKPRQFIKTKDDLAEKIDVLKFAIENKDDNEIIILCKMFLQGILKRIGNIELKKDVVDLIYEIRYYRYTLFNDSHLKDYKELKTVFNSIMKQLVKKAIEYKVLEGLTEDFNINYNIIKMIFDTRIINLKEINVECEYKDGKLYVQYFDDQTFETKVEIKVKEEIKIRKKSRLFI